MSLDAKSIYWTFVLTNMQGFKYHKMTLLIRGLDCNICSKLEFNNIHCR